MKNFIELTSNENNSKFLLNIDEILEIEPTHYGSYIIIKLKGIDSNGIDSNITFKVKESYDNIKSKLNFLIL